jgi:hypothetical protein
MSDEQESPTSVEVVVDLCEAESNAAGRQAPNKYCVAVGQRWRDTDHRRPRTLKVEKVNLVAGKAQVRVEDVPGEPCPRTLRSTWIRLDRFCPHHKLRRAE